MGLCSALFPYKIGRVPLFGFDTETVDISQVFYVLHTLTDLKIIYKAYKSVNTSVGISLEWKKF